MASMKYCDKHNQLGFFKKPEESTWFAEIVDFLKGSTIWYALTHNPTIHDSLDQTFLQTATAITLAEGFPCCQIMRFLRDEVNNEGIPNEGTFKFWKAFLHPMEIFSPSYFTLCCLWIMEHRTSRIRPPPVTQPSPSEPLPSSSPPPVISATTESEPTPVAESTSHPNSLSPEPDNEPIEHTFEQPSSEHQPLSPRQETEIPQSRDPTHPHVAEERPMTVDDLL
ncbi:hypothetical protein Tco_0359057 [Tanacetum coccineum]